MKSINVLIGILIIFTLSIYYLFNQYVRLSRLMIGIVNTEKLQSLFVYQNLIMLMLTGILLVAVLVIVINKKTSK